MESQLIGYVRLSNSKQALKIAISKDAIERANPTETKDGSMYYMLVINAEKVRKMIYTNGDDPPVTSITQIHTEG